ncbi:ComEC/Rec2 family competence protein [Persicitalea sp.]|uniref:ComEC/Rec2 family competence protein n=1 Tax=Persicitalea sp. TaxID=3100273 RepID=UPI003592FB1E
MFATQPFLRFILPLVAGILTIDFLSDEFGTNVPNLSLILLIGSLLLLGGVNLARRTTKASPVLLIIALICLGAYVTDRKKKEFKAEVVALDGIEYDSYLLRINSLGQKRKAFIRYEAELISTHSNDGWQEKTSRLLVSLPDSAEVLPKAGDQIMVKGYLPKRPAIPLNPNEFNYRKYLERKGVAWTAFLPENSFKVLPSKDLASTHWATAISQKADSVFKTQLNTPTSYGLLKAMVLGRRDDLGADLLNSYITAGAIHVLAVSGLHVGVFFLLISFILKGLKKNQWGKWLYLALIIGLLSAYAIITGLSPSVVRASIMCVTFAISQAFTRQHHGINTLAISAFLILLFDPMALFSVGFQLSYAAVLGIILFYPLFKNNYQTDALLFRWLWQITLVSLSAQVFTFPLSVYYFHQFPTYFWLINPFVIGLTTLLIYSAVALLFVSIFHWQPLTDLVAYWTDGVAHTLNTFVEIPQRMPNYLLGNLNFDLMEVIALLAFMLFVYKLFKEREMAWLKVVTICSLVFSSYSIARTLNNFTAPQMLVHSVPRHTVLSATQGQTAYIIADSDFKYDTLNYGFHLKDYFNAQGIRQTEYLDLPDRSENVPIVVKWNNLALGIDSQVFSGNSNFSIIRARQYPNTEKLVTTPNTTFILTQELGFKTKNQWKKLLGEARSPITDLAENGAIEF